MSRDPGVARRCSTEGEAGDGDVGGGQFGPLKSQLQPEICQNEDQTLVRKDQKRPESTVLKREMNQNQAINPVTIQFSFDAWSKILSPILLHGFSVL